MISKWNLEDFFLADSFYIYFTLMQSCTCCRNMQSLLASRPLTLSFYLHTCITIYVLYFEHYGNSFVDIHICKLSSGSEFVQISLLCDNWGVFFHSNLRVLLRPNHSTVNSKGLKFQGIWQHQWAIMSLSQKAKSLKTVDSQMVWNI